MTNSISVQITIKYNWWTDKKNINLNKHRDFLDKEANKRINEMRIKNYTAGELHTTIINNEKEYNINGWWEMNTKTL